MAATVSRKEAGRILGMTNEGVRKYESRGLSPVKRGVAVHYASAEVNALKAKRGAVVPAASKAEREDDAFVQAFLREEAAEQRKAEQARRKAEASAAREAKALAATFYTSDPPYGGPEWQKADAARQVNEDALRAHAGDFARRTVDASGAAAILGPPHTVYSVADLERRQLLTQAVLSPALVERFSSEELERACRNACRGYGARYERADVERLKAETLAMVMAHASTSGPAARALRATSAEDVEARLLSWVSSCLMKLSKAG